MTICVVYLFIPWCARSIPVHISGQHQLPAWPYSTEYIWVHKSQVKFTVFYMFIINFIRNSQDYVYSIWKYAISEEKWDKLNDVTFIFVAINVNQSNNHSIYIYVCVCLCLYICTNIHWTINKDKAQFKNARISYFCHLDQHLFIRFYVALFVSAKCLHEKGPYGYNCLTKRPFCPINVTKLMYD